MTTLQDTSLEDTISVASVQSVLHYRANLNSFSVHPIENSVYITDLMKIAKPKKKSSLSSITISQENRNPLTVLHKVYLAFGEVKSSTLQRTFAKVIVFFNTQLKLGDKVYKI